MSVVQRCPNCGTLGATSGECEACHEAQVRYFCTNHMPGLWLDAPECPNCGARLGDSIRQASAPAPTIPVSTRAPAREPAAPPSLIAPPSPSYSRARRSDDGWASRERLPLGDAEELDPFASRMPLWQQILRAAVRARTMRPAPDREGPSIGRAARGCLMRLVLVILLLLVTLAGVLYLIGRPLL
jgi:predicted RNA-binding Zn-ribbon protein involved in translation (DUF1610 family)